MNPTPILAERTGLQTDATHNVPMALSQMLLQHSLIYTASRVVAIAAMLFATFAYTRLLSPQEYGFYNLVNTGVTLAFTTTMLWICSSGLRLLHATQDRRALRAGLLVSYLSILAVVALVGAAALLVIPDSGHKILIMIGLAMLAMVGWLELNLHLLIAEPRPIEYGCLNAVRALAAVALGTTFAFAGWGAPGALAGSIFGMLVPSIWIAARYWHDVRLKTLRKATFREIAVYGLPLLGSSGLSGLSRSTDRLLIAALAGAHAVGLYAVGFNIADNLIAALLAPIGGAGFSLAVRALEREGHEAASRQLAENVVLLIGVGLPAATGLALVSQNIVNTLIGSEFRDVAATVIPILAFGSFMNCVRAYYLDHAFQLGRRTGFQSVMMLVIALTSVATNVILIPWYEAIGAATAVLLTHSFGVILCYSLGRCAYRLPLPIPDFAKVVLATAVMAMPVVALREYHGVFWLTLQILLGVVVYLVAVLVLNVGNFRDKIFRRD
ncbi:MAG: lipopolysaccharide biosynthesis protein [Aestuariivirga sp.]